MRNALLVTLISLVALSGCSGSDDDTGGGAGSSGASGSAGSGGSGGSGASGGSAGAAGATSGDTWDNYAQAFFASYCTECHKPGTARDYTQLAEVVTDQDRIRCGVASSALSGCGTSPPPRQFPVGTGPKPGDAERDRLVQWIEAGLP